VTTWCPALQARQHPTRLGQIRGFAHDLTTGKNQCVRAQHQGIGNFFGDDPRLAMRVELAKFLRRQLIVEHFRGVAGNHLKIQIQLPQQFRAPG
jgi:hypothetical protein